MEKEKPCPFCNQKSVELVGENNESLGTVNIRIRCRTCEALGPASMTKKGAVDWWNTRDYKEE